MRMDAKGDFRNTDDFLETEYRTVPRPGGGGSGPLAEDGRGEGETIEEVRIPKSDKARGLALTHLSVARGWDGAAPDAVREALRRHRRIGGFTTWSHFVVEADQLADADQVFMAGVYVLSSITVGVLAAAAGAALVGSLTRTPENGGT